MKLKSILAAVAAGVALASPLAAKAYTYNDGTYEWGFYTSENEDNELVATLRSVSRVDGQKISGAITFPATVSLTVTNELGYSKLDDKTGKYNWVQTRAPKIETLTFPVEQIGQIDFYYEESDDDGAKWTSLQYDPLITSVTIPEGVKYVDGLVGECLTNVTAVTFPSTVEDIESCFGSCAKLASVSVPEDAYIDDAFIGTAWAKAMGDFFVWNKNLIRYQGTATEIVVPEGVETIGTGAFSANWLWLYDEEEMKRLASATNITSVLLPSSLEEIGSGAFSGCEKLAAIDIPNGVYSIGSSAFNGTALTSIALPKSIRSLGGDAFAYTAISTFAIPEGLQDLTETCEYMTNLTSVTIPATAKNLSWTFSGCSKLTAIDIPAKVEEIWYGTFRNCKALTSVTGGAGLKYVDSYAFGDDPHWDYEKWEWVEGTGVPFYDNAADGFRVLGPVAYGYKGKCPETLTVPAGVKYVMDSVISDNDSSAVKTITLSDGVETVGGSAFANCYNLETVNLGNTVTNLALRAFNNCSVLSNVTGGAALQVGYNAFWGTPVLAKLASDFENKDMPFELVRLANSKVVVGYKGKFPAGSFAIPDDVTDFGLYNLGSSRTNVTAITGGAAIIGSVAFNNFTGLTEVNLPTVKSWSFSGCTNLVNVTLGTAGAVSSRAFLGCDKLASVKLVRPGYKVTGYEAMFDCTDEYWEYLSKETFAADDVQVFKYFAQRTDFANSSWNWSSTGWSLFSIIPQFVKVMVDESSLEPFDNSVKNDYVGILYDTEGKFAGTFEASVKKASKTKDATATFKFTPVGGKKVTLKGAIDANGKGQGDLAGLTFGANGVVGKLTYTDKKGVTTVYEVAGSDNIAKSKDKADKAFLKDLKGKAWGISGRAADHVTESDFANGNVAMSIVMGSSGKATVSGVLPNGTKVSQNVQLIVGANAMAIPLSFTKSKESFGFVLWLDEKARASRVEGCEWVGKGASSKDLFVAEFGDGAHGNALVAKTGLPDPTFVLSAKDLPKALDLTADALELLPRYEGFELKNGKVDKWTFLKAPKVKFDKNGVLDVAALEKDIAAGKTNVSDLKLKLTKKSGEFKGSFNVWAKDKKGKVKKQTVTVNGVMIDGIGYGSGFIKKVGAMPVRIGNENLKFVEED